MNKKYSWLPIDERLIPDVVSFKYPKSPWVRGMLALEMILAVLAVVGTLVIAILPRSTTTTTTTINAETSTPPVSQY